MTGRCGRACSRARSITTIVTIVTIGTGIMAISSSSARAESSVVGRSDRNHFGRWEWVPFPLLTLGIGTSTHMFAIDGFSLTNGKGQTTSAQPYVPSDLLRGNTVVAQTIDLRPMQVHVAGPFYVGPLVEIGPAFRSGTPNTPGYSASSTGLFFEGGLLPGFDMRLGDSPITVRFEALIGGRLTSFAGNAPPTSASQGAFVGNATSWVAAPRVAIDFWTSPFVTLGAFAGTNLVHRADYVFGIAIAAHLAAFDESP